MDRITTYKQKGHTVLKFQGKLSITHANEIRDALINAIGKKKRPEIDLGEVGEIDAAILQLLCSAIKSAEAKGGEIHWHRISDACLAAARMTGMFKGKWFKI